MKCLKGNKMKNVIKFFCLLLASEVFAQEVNSEFLWSASEDSTERVITGSLDETSGYWYSFENGQGFNIWDMDQTGVDITKWQGLCVEYKSSSDMELLLINEEQQALSSNLKFGKLLKASDSVLTVNISWKNMEQLECCFDGVKIEDYIKILISLPSLHVATPVAASNLTLMKFIAGEPMNPATNKLAGLL